MTVMPATLFDRRTATARRLRLTLAELATLMRALPAHQAIGFFAMPDAFPDEVPILPRSQLDAAADDVLPLPREWEQ